MAVPLFKAHNGSIFVQKGHYDTTGWVSNAQSTKKLGKKSMILMMMKKIGATTTTTTGMKTQTMATMKTTMKIGTNLPN